MLKNGFLGRRDEPQTPAGGRASPDSPRYAPQPDAPRCLPSRCRTRRQVQRRGARATEVKARQAPQAAICCAKRQRPPPLPHRSATQQRPAAAPTAAAKFTVGPNIKLKGAEINDCDTLVVEGHVEASMDSKTLEILENWLLRRHRDHRHRRNSRQVRRQPHRPQES